jgi:hypothetical protein
VKNRDTLRPSSAIWAIASALTGFFRLVVFFIELFLLSGGLPKRHEMVELSISVLSTSKMTV